MHGATMKISKFPPCLHQVTSMSLLVGNFYISGFQRVLCGSQGVLGNTIL